MSNIRSIHKRIVNNLFRSNNAFYRNTIIDGVNAFLIKYDGKYFAYDMIISCDYPIFNGEIDLKSICYVEKYLQCIEIENRFCLLFDPVDLDCYLIT